MRRILFTVPAAILALTALTGGVSAQVTSEATYEVKAINEISVSGNPAALVIETAAQLTDGVTDVSTTWSVSTNQSGAKITGGIDLAMANDVTLKVNLAAPTGATSANDVTLSTVAEDLVTGISEVQASGLGVTYTLSALPTAGVVASTTRTVTYTITGGV